MPGLFRSGWDARARCGLQREAEGKCAALAVSRVDCDRASHGIAEPPRDREPETGPFERTVKRHVLLHKRFEQQADRLGVDPGAGILDRKIQSRPAGQRGGNDADDHRSARSEFDGVADEVDQDLPDPALVSRELLRQARIHHAEEFQPFVCGGFSVRDNCRPDKGGDRYRRGFQRDMAFFNAGEIEDVVDDLKEVVSALGDDPGEVDLFLVERGLGQQLRKPEHAVERGAQLVAHDGQKFALRAVRGLGPLDGREPDVLDRFPVGDVFLDRDVGDGLSSAVEHRGDRRGFPIQRTVLALVLELAPPGFPGGDRGPEIAVKRMLVQAGLEDAGILPDRLGGGKTRGFLEGRVHVFDVPPRVGDDDGVGALLDGGQEFPPVFLRLLVRGDVNQRHAACRRAVFVHPGGHLQMRKERGRVLPDHPEVALLRLARLQEVLPAAVVEVLTFLGDEAGQAPSDQRAAP